MGYTGEGKDRNIWTGRLAVTEINPKKDNDLTTKKYVDDNVGGAITNLDGGNSADTFIAIGMSPIDGGDST